MSYEVVRLGDVADIVSGKNAPKDNDLGNIGVPFIRAGNLEYLCAVGLEDNLEKINEELNEKYRFNILPGQSVIFAKSGMSILKDRVYLTKVDTFIVNHLAGVITNNEILSPNYLKYYLYIKKPSSLVNDTSYPSLRLEDIKEIQIPLPPLEIQKKIADSLDKAQELIDKRKEQISALDKFLENLFLDMFGDPVNNPMGWTISYIEQLVLNEKGSIKRGPFGGALKKEIFVSEGYLVYEQYHALNNDFSFERYYITEKKFNELKGFEVKEGDIIISCSGVYLGKLAVIPKNHKKGIINQALLKISLNENKMKNIFYKFIFTHPNFKNKYFANTNGSGIPNFPSMEEFKKFEFILPPLNLQNQFASIVEKVEAEKIKLEASLTEMEDNFNSIMQRAFKGELF